MALAEAKTESMMVTDILNGIISAVTTVFPLNINKGKLERLKTSLNQPEMGVLIGITGDFRSRMVIEAKKETFSRLALRMYGMALEGDMLESFVGEIGNMVGGNMCTKASEQEISLDITHPTVLVGQTKLTGFKTGLSLPIELESLGEIKVILLLDQD